MASRILPIGTPHTRVPTPDRSIPDTIRHVRPATIATDADDPDLRRPCPALPRAAPPARAAALVAGRADGGAEGRRAPRAAPVRPARGARRAEPRPRAPRTDPWLRARLVRAVAVRARPPADRDLQQEPQPRADARAAALPH